MTWQWFAIIIMSSEVFVLLNKQLAFTESKAKTLWCEWKEQRKGMIIHQLVGIPTHRLLDQQTKYVLSLATYRTTARIKSSFDEVSHHTRPTTRNCCSSVTLLNNLHWAEWTCKCWLLGVPVSESHLTQGVVTSFPSFGSAQEFRDKSRMHKPREAATAIERPFSLPIAAIRHGPFDA